MRKSVLISGVATAVAALLAAVPAPAGDIDQLTRDLAGASALTRNASAAALLEELSATTRPSVSAEAKSRLEALFRAGASRETILLAGLAGVDVVAEEIRAMAARPIAEPAVGKFYGTNEWAANLVQARGGDSQSTAKLLAFARTQDLHTQVVYVLPDLGYVPQPEVVEYLKRFVDGEERLEPVKETVKGALAGTYAAASLARILDGFPLPYREDFSYSDEDLQICRDWLARQPAWRFR